MGSTILTNVSKYLPGFFIGILLKDILTFTFISLFRSENVIQKTAASFTICICEEFSHNMNSFDQILGRVSLFFHQTRCQTGERMRGGTGSGSFYRENVHTDRARQGLTTATLTDATRKHKHVLYLYICTGHSNSTEHRTLYIYF